MTHNPPTLRKSTPKRIVKTLSSQNKESGMSLGIAIRGPEGIVLAADSRVTKVLHPMDELAAVEFLLNKLQDTKTNAKFFEAMKR